MTGATISEGETGDATVQLKARVSPDGANFIATVDGLDLEGRGNTPAAAGNALVQAMRGWLERLDTTGKLGEALGLDCLDEQTEIVLEIIGADQQA